MRTTIDLDKELLAEAERLTGEQEPSILVREGLKALVERESARQMARFAGSIPSATVLDGRQAPANEEQQPTREKRPVVEVLAEIWAAQEARGHVPPTAEEVDRYLADERASWDR